LTRVPHGLAGAFKCGVRVFKDRTGGMVCCFIVPFVLFLVETDRHRGGRESQHGKTLSLLYADGLRRQYHFDIELDKQKVH
jgi:hypothetical protein